MRGGAEAPRSLAPSDCYLTYAEDSQEGAFQTAFYGLSAWAEKDASEMLHGIILCKQTNARIEAVASVLAFLLLSGKVPHFLREIISVRCSRCVSRFYFCRSNTAGIEGRLLLHNQSSPPNYSPLPRSTQLRSESISTI